MRKRESLDFPKTQGMYDPENEKDSCGIGFVANIKGEKSHQIIKDGLTILENLTHRGATGADPETGDGAGILIQIPDKFFRKVCSQINITLPDPGNYAIGVVFLPPHEADSKVIQKTINAAVEGEGLEVLGWRDVPVNETVPGIVARKGMPTIKQIFIKNTLGDVETFERKVYTARRVVAQNVAKLTLNRWDLFHIPSFSSKTIVYKGMLIAHQLPKFYKDLNDADMVSALSLVHQRYSTNTFPSWTLAQPFHFLCHNGEINTLRGNVNWMLSRENLFNSDRFGDDIKKLLPIIRPLSSDSFSFDNALELLVMSGYSLPHAMMLLVPEAWEKDTLMDEDKKAFYQYNATKMEPWDGPAAIAFSDGTYIGATLDRNGLRPARYIITKDDRIILGSESGVLDISPENIKETWRLQPGKMLVCDLKNGRIIKDDEVKKNVIKGHPYAKWVEDNLIRLEDVEDTDSKEKESAPLKESQILFGYNVESINKIIAPMATNGVEPLGSMGADTPPAVLSDKPQILYNYFKQLFAQVTNPPIDPIREELVMSLTSYLGPEGNLLQERPEDCRRLKVSQPILTNKEMAKMKSGKALKCCLSSTLFNIAEGEKGFAKALDKICNDAVKSVEGGYQLLVLSDRGANAVKCHLPPLLAVGAVHHHLIRNKVRGKIGLVIETGEAFEVHHHALLLGYGAGAINPYIVFDTIAALLEKNLIKGKVDLDTSKNHYIKACGKGLYKIFSKMGISTLQSYMGAQIFEAVGLCPDLIEKYFTLTPSKIKGIGLKEVAEETMVRHRMAFDSSPIPSGGEYAWRKEG
ncbi:MAG: glutamate synthase central domain-containing protein, partial [Nitrospinota bacterium]